MQLYSLKPVIKEAIRDIYWQPIFNIEVPTIWQGNSSTDQWDDKTGLNMILPHFQSTAEYKETHLNSKCHCILRLTLQHTG